MYVYAIVIKNEYVYEHEKQLRKITKAERDEINIQQSK